MKRQAHEVYGFGAGRPTRTPRIARFIIAAFVVAFLAAVVW